MYASKGGTMNKKFKVTISIIASMIIILGSAFTIYAATTEYSLKSHGIIAHDGDGDGAYTNTAKDIYIDSGDLKTINDAVVAGKTSLASAINSATASSATNKTTLGTTDANLPAFNDLKNAIANVKAAGNEEGIITGQNNVINNVGGKTSVTLEDDGTLKLGYDGTTGTPESPITNPTWAAIENKLSGKTDADGNPIYSGITNLDSLESAITADNDNYTKEYVEQNNCKRIVYLGSGSTYDLSSYDGYTSFTNSNFIVGITSGGIGCDTYMAGDGNRYSYSVNPSYNSSTGKLTISVGGSSSASSCAFYSFSANYNVYLIY